MKKQGYLLGIDNGTQSVRALLFDTAGALVGQSKVILPEKSGKDAEFFEQDPNVFWDAVIEAMAMLWASSGVDSNEVLGVSVTAQRATMICLDDELQPLRPSVSWMDQRRCEQLSPMPWHWRALIKLVGMSKSLQFAREKAPSNWIAAHQPELWKKTRYYVQVSGYLNTKLTGKCVDSLANQVGFVAFDYKKQQWCGLSAWQWSAFGLTPEQMPTLKAAGERLGELTVEAAEALGLPSGLPVFASGADKACDVLGMGITAKHVGVASVSLGTRATLVQCSTKYTQDAQGLPAYPALVSNEYLAEYALARGFWLVTWFKKAFATLIDSIPNARLADEDLDVFLSQTAPGADGLVLQPTWGSDVDPSPDIRGALLGFNGAQTQAHIYRALIEGIVLGLFEGKDLLEKQTKQPIERLRVSGGGAQSPLVVQVVADVFGLPVECIHTTETSSLGAVMSVAVGSGVYASLEEAAEAMVTVTHVVHPNEENHRLYQRLYTQVYQKMKQPLSKLHRAIQNAQLG